MSYDDGESASLLNAI